MMPSWKKRLFVKAILNRMKEENKTVTEILMDYSQLTEDEKNEILSEISQNMG